MDKDFSAARELQLVAAHLNSAKVPWCLFGGAGAQCYGVTRSITDIDILVRLTDKGMLGELLPFGKIRRKGVIDFGFIEIIAGDLPLKAEGLVHVWTFDDDAILRFGRMNFLGSEVFAMSAEDLIVIKAILQRGPERGKFDVEDVKGILAKGKAKLDFGYIKLRAERCGASARVEALLGNL